MRVGASLIWGGSNKPFEWSGHHQLSILATTSSLPATHGRRCHLDNITLPQAAHIDYIYVVEDDSRLDCLHGHVKLIVVKVQAC